MLCGGRSAVLSLSLQCITSHPYTVHLQYSVAERVLHLFDVFCMCFCVLHFFCVDIYERQREREREVHSLSVCLCVCVSVCVSVCAMISCM